MLDILIGKATMLTIIVMLSGLFVLVLGILAMYSAKFVANDDDRYDPSTDFPFVRGLAITGAWLFFIGISALLCGLQGLLITIIIIFGPVLFIRAYILRRVPGFFVKFFKNDFMEVLKIAFNISNKTNKD